MSGRLWEQKRIVRYYLHRWPSQRAMKRLREKVRDRTGANRGGTRIEWVIEDLNPILRGWGNYFRTGNAAKKFGQVDRYVVRRLRRLLIRKRGRNLRRRRGRSNGPKTGSTRRGCTGSAAPSAIRRLRNHVKKTIGKPCAGKPHARIERGMGKHAGNGHAPLTTNDWPHPGPPRAGVPRGPARVSRLGEDHRCRAAQVGSPQRVRARRRRVGQAHPHDTRRHRGRADRHPRHPDGLPATGEPGAAPYTRGRLAQKPETGWDIRPLVDGPDAKSANQAALTDLENGATSLWLQLGSGLEPGDLARVLERCILDLAPVVLDAPDDPVGRGRGVRRRARGAGRDPGAGHQPRCRPDRRARADARVSRRRLAQPPRPPGAWSRRSPGWLARPARSGSSSTATAVHDLGASDVPGARLQPRRRARRTSGSSPPPAVTGRRGRSG